MSVVVDASIGILWVVREEGSRRAVRLLDESPIVPGLFFAECANVLWKMAVRRDLTPSAARARATTLLEVRLEIVPDQDLMADALRLACELNHPAYDCLYVAAAQARDARLVTADRRLVERCRTASSTRLRRIVVSLDDV